MTISLIRVLSFLIITTLQDDQKKSSNSSILHKNKSESFFVINRSVLETK